MSARIYFHAPPLENFAYCTPVGDVSLWESHRHLVGSFASSLLSEWTLDMDTWENTVKAEEEEESLKYRSYQDNKSTYAMVLDAPNPEDSRKEYGLELYEKLWGAVAS